MKWMDEWWQDIYMNRDKIYNIHIHIYILDRRLKKEDVKNKQLKKLLLFFLLHNNNNRNNNKKRKIPDRIESAQKEKHDI